MSILLLSLGEAKHGIQSEAHGPSEISISFSTAPAPPPEEVRHSLCSIMVECIDCLLDVGAFWL